MPEWVLQTIDRSVLGAIVLFGMWGIVRLCEFCGPKVTEFFTQHKLLILALINDREEKKEQLESIECKTKDGFATIHQKLDGIKEQLKDQRHAPNQSG